MARWLRLSLLLIVLLGGVSPTAAADPISYRLVRQHGRLVIRASDGTVLPWICYGVSSERDLPGWQAKNQPFIKSGVHLFQVAVWPDGGDYWRNQFWSNDGKPVTEPRASAKLDEQATWLLAQDPEARFIIRFSMRADREWQREHPDEYVPIPRKAPHGGGDGSSSLPSMASAAWLSGIEQLIHDLIAYCERQPWRDRIVGYSLFPYGEGVTEIGIHGLLFDRSPVMTKRFREFLQAKYRTDAALQAAWREPAVTLAAAAVPSLPEWQEKKRGLGLLHWPDPQLVQRELDYFTCHQQLTHAFWKRVFDAMAANTRARPVLKGYDIFKQHMLGWIHNGDFFAEWQAGTLDNYGAALLASGSIGIGPLLDHPGIDMLQTPGMYYNRAMGYAWEAEGLSDSLNLRDKANFMEADLRTWVDRDWNGRPNPPGSLIRDAGTFLTPAEMQAGFDRSLAWALSRNQMYYFMSVCGANWWFDDEVVQKQIARQQEIVTTAVNRLPWRNTEHAICLVVDDESPLSEDFSAGFQQLAVEQQLEEGLAMAGVPYRIHLLSDLRRDNFPAYRCYLFPNLFRIDQDIEDLLHEKVLRSGNVAIFGPGTGINDGKQLTAAPASRLFGVPMELVAKSVPRRVVLQDHGHPISKRLPQVTFGDSYAYGPLLVPKTQRLPAMAKQANALGAAFYFYFFDRPGLFVNEFGKGARGAGGGERGADDYAVVFTPAVPLPAAVLRECARYAGCNVWSEENAVVYASDTFVGYHTVRSGRHTIHLPKPTAVWDLQSGKNVADETSEISFEVKAPSTRLFHLGPLRAE